MVYFELVLNNRNRSIVQRYMIYLLHPKLIQYYTVDFLDPVFWNLFELLQIVWIHEIVLVMYDALNNKQQNTHLLDAIYAQNLLVVVVVVIHVLSLVVQLYISM